MHLQGGLSVCLGGGFRRSEAPEVVAPPVPLNDGHEAFADTVGTSWQIVFASTERVYSVLGVCCGTQVCPTVVRPNPVSVINLIARPCAFHDGVCDPVDGVRSSPESHDNVAVGARPASCRTSMGPLANRFPPEQEASFRLIPEDSLDRFDVSGLPCSPLRRRHQRRLSPRERPLLVWQRSESSRP